MTTFKKTFLIALAAQLAYWLLAGLVFGKGQLLLHSATAVVAATYLVVQIFRKIPKFKWASILAWPALIVACYQVIKSWIGFINWTLADGIIPTNAPTWNVVRFLDMVLVSFVLALAIKYYAKMRQAKSPLT